MIGVGTMLMITKKKTADDQEMSGKDVEYMSTDGGSVAQKQRGMGTFSWAAGCCTRCSSALFASLTAILGKVGISDINSNLGTAIGQRWFLSWLWLMVFVSENSMR